MSEGHLYLSSHGGLVYASDSRTAWYDQAHSSIFLICPKSKMLRQLALNTSVQKELDPINHTEAVVRLLYDLSSHFPQENDTKSASSVIAECILGIKLSLDRQYLAIQRSDVQVQVIHLSSGEVYWICVKPKSGNRILHDGIIWNSHSYQPGSSQDLFLITKIGIEQYRVSSKRRNCALHRFINVLVHNFWYDPDHSGLIVSTGTRANEIIPILLCGPTAERLPKVTFASSIRKNDLFLASMYEQLFAIYGDMQAAKLLVYIIEKSRVSCFKSFNLLFPPGTALDFSVVDNLLVCHSLDFNVSLFFDIKSEYNGKDPFSSPLPISLEPPQMIKKALVRETHRDLVKNFQSKTSLKHYKDLDAPQDLVRMATLSINNIDEEENTSILSNVSAKMDHHHSIEGKEGSEYLTKWHFLQPNLVRQSIQVKDCKDLFEKVEIRKLQINLREISKSSTRNPDLIPFLLRRGDDKVVKELVLKSIHDALLENISLSKAFRFFTLVQTLSYRAETHSSILKEYNLKSSENSWSYNNSSGSGSRGSESSNSEEEADNPMTGNQHRLAPKEFATHIGPPAAIRNRFFSDYDKKLSHIDSKAEVASLRNAQGEVLIFQSEFYHQVWHRLLLNEEIVSSGRLNMYICEYIRSLQQNNFPAENITYLALAKSFVASGKQNELYQFLQYQVPSDSIELADTLLRESKNSSPQLVQAALDIYLRLDAYVPLIKALLVLGETSKAMTLAWQKFSNNRNHQSISSESMVNASNIPANLFYDSMVRSLIQKKSSPLTMIKELECLVIFLEKWDLNSLQLYQENGNVSLLAIQAQEPFPSIENSMYNATFLRLQRKLGFASNITITS